MNTIAIIQARMASTRLPGKVLIDIESRPMLSRVVTRVKQAKTVSGVVVATSDTVADDPVAAFCDRQKIACFRGSETDVLDRFYQTATQYQADAVVRITADCPLIDPDVIDRVVTVFLNGDYDYVSNTLRYTYPDGLDVEVFSFAALQTAWKKARKLSQREHVTPYIRLCGQFKLHNVARVPDLSPYNYRWTVDTPQDLQFVRKIYQNVADESSFRLPDVLNLLEKMPNLQSLQADEILNAGYYKTLYDQAEAGAAPPLTLTESKRWFERSQTSIPGCAQTFSKGYTQYVQGAAPVFLQRGKGCRVWDVDGNEYIDYVQGLLPNILGYANEEVNQAATAQLSMGHSFSLPHHLEVELAERLIRLIPAAEAVRFGKNGSDATAGAIRAARAYTGRDRVACCGYHGWQDWFIGSTTRNGGVPQAVRDLTHPFPYNNLEALEQILEQHPGQFAAIIMEPVNFVAPEPGYLEGVRYLAHKHGALLVFDEICSGFHFGLGGAQKKYGVIPDMACFGKAMGNGFPIACVVGKQEIMRVFADIFFSFTFAGEVASMAAAMKVLDILEQTDVLIRMETQGKRLQDGFNALAKVAGLQDRLQCVGFPVWSLIQFKDAAGKASYLERSLFGQEAIKRGLLLLVTHNITGAHDEVSIERTLEIYASVFKTLADWLSDSNPARFLEGKMVEPVFKVR